MSGVHESSRRALESVAQRRLAWAFFLTLVFFVTELGIGLTSGSLALMSDAGHMASDVLALGTALVAARVVARNQPSLRYSYGKYRAEVIASAVVATLMLGVGSYVVIEALSRMGSHGTVMSTPVMIVGVVGLAVNAVVALVLKGGSRDSLNMRSAYSEVVADAAGSVGVIIASGLVWWTGSAWWDTIVALAIGVFVGIRAMNLWAEVLTILTQQVPRGIDIEAVERSLRSMEGVVDVHDLHVWNVTSGMNVATAHLVVTPDVHPDAAVLGAIDMVHMEHTIEHGTFQIEYAASAHCQSLKW